MKSFVGTGENALRIQIWTALIAILLLKWLHHLSKAKWSLSNLASMLRLNCLLIVICGSGWTTRSRHRHCCLNPNNLPWRLHDLDRHYRRKRQTSNRQPSFSAPKGFGFNHRHHNPVLSWTAVTLCRSPRESDSVPTKSSH